MNNLMKGALILQVPNLFLLVFGIIWLALSLGLTTIFYIIIGTIYGLINIASLILFICGLGKNGRRD